MSGHSFFCRLIHGRYIRSGYVGQRLTSGFSKKHFTQELRSIAFVRMGHFFGRTTGKNFASATSALGSHINQIIGRLDHIQIMFNDQHRITLLYQTIQYLK